MTLESFINKQSLLDVKIRYRHKTINYTAISNILNNFSESDFDNTQKLLETLELETFSVASKSGLTKNPSNQSKIMKELFEASKHRWYGVLESLNIDVSANLDVSTEMIYKKVLEQTFDVDNKNIEIVRKCLLADFDKDLNIKNLYSRYGIMGYIKLYVDLATNRLFMYYESHYQQYLLEIIIK